MPQVRLNIPNADSAKVKYLSAKIGAREPTVYVNLVHLALDAGTLDDVLMALRGPVLTKALISQPAPPKKKSPPTPAPAITMLLVS